MRAALRLLVIVGLIWCALGIAEPGLAHAAVSTQQAVDAGDPASKSNDAAIPDLDGHHHCPVAPALPQPPMALHTADGSVLPFVSPMPALASVTRAPPLQPPAA